MIIVTSKKCLVTLFVVAISSLSISGCGYLNGNVKENPHKNNQEKRILKTIQHTPTPKPKRFVRKIKSDCSYIIRDLSIPNAKDVWCVPRALQ